MTSGVFSTSSNINNTYDQDKSETNYVLYFFAYKKEHTNLHYTEKTER